MSSDCGARLIPHELDRLAKADPQGAVCAIPQDQFDVKKGFEDITYSRLANAVNKVAWWLDQTLGRSQTLEVIAYLAPQDIRYVLFMIAAAKAGYVVCWRRHLMHCILTDAIGFICLPQE